VVYTFGDFQLDSRARQLRRSGEPVALSDRLHRDETKKGAV
jgi:DNA-binding winged helix-turn-helix (wHTH) protein